MRRTLAFLLLSAPIAASAQLASPPIRQMSPLGVTTQQQRPNGITVTASAQSSVHAVSALVTLWLSTSNNAMTLNADSVKPIADALIEAGADPSSIDLPINFSAPGYSNSASIKATFHNPKQADMQKGVNVLAAAFAKMPNLRLNSVTVDLTNNDCANAIDDARAKAISYAHHKALDVAKQVGVGLGAVINVNAGDQGTSYSLCRSTYNVGPAGASFNQYQPVDEPYVTIPVTSNVTITYAIK